MEDPYKLLKEPEPDPIPDWVPTEQELGEFEKRLAESMNQERRTFDVSLTEQDNLLIKDNKGAAFLTNLNDSQLANLKAFLEEL